MRLAFCFVAVAIAAIPASALIACSSDESADPAPSGSSGTSGSSGASGTSGGSGSSGAPNTKDSAADPLPDAGSTSPDATVDAGASCNTLVQQGGPVDFVSVSAAAPVPTGGVIVDGTYVRTAYQTHLGADAVLTPGAGGMTIQLTGTTIQTVNVDGKGKETRRTEHYALSGTDFNVTYGACSSPSFSAPFMPQGKYTATPTSLTIQVTGGGGTSEQVFTKK